MSIKNIFYGLWMILTITVLLTDRIEAAQLHAILVADTVTGEYEVESSLDFMKREVKKIAAFTDLELNALSFEGYQVRVENVLQHISELDIGADDVVILYFATHGSRTHQKESQWPDLIFTLDIAFSGENGYLDFGYVNEMIKNKHPRLFLSLANSCNSYRTGDVGEEEWTEEDEDEDTEGNLKKNVIFPIPTPSSDKIVLSKDQKDFLNEVSEEGFIQMYRHLFLNQKGTLIISSSVPGEPSIKQPITGGVYTVQFLKVLYQIASMGDLMFEDPEFKENSWQFILENVSAKTKEVLALENLSETSQYECMLN